MLPPSRKTGLAVIPIFIQFAYADTSNLNPGGVGCVDPSGYEACYAANVKQSTSCVNLCTSNNQASQECIVGCGNYNQAANIGCWLGSCWNEVYSCAYQGTVIQWLDGTDLEQTGQNLPFYPAPPNAPGACTCNLGNVYGNITDLTISTANDCSSLYANPTNLFDCDCCLVSHLISNVYNICPNTNITALGFSSWLSTEVGSIVDAQQSLSFTAGSTLPDCTNLEASPNACAADYNLDIAGTTWINPLALPAGFPGSNPPSDGPGSITSPLFGSVTTLTLFPGYTSVITAAAYNAKNAGNSAAATGTVAGGASGAGGAGSTGSAGTSATGTAKKSGGSFVEARGFSMYMAAIAVFSVPLITRS